MKDTNRTSLQNVTPKALRCASGFCPAVYRQEGGELVIIGKRQPKIAAKLMVKGKVGTDEDVVVIPESCFDDLKRVRSRK